MDIERLAQDLRHAATSRLLRTQECPDVHDLAAAAAGTLAAEVREQMQTHLADCDYCIARIGELARLPADGEPEALPDLLLARARRLAAGDRRSSRLPGLAFRPWAAAAVLVLALVVIVQQPWVPRVDDAVPPDIATAAGDNPPAARRIDPDAVRPLITSPAPGSTIRLADAQLSWTPIDGGLYYEVFILSEDGDVLWQRQVNGTSLELQVAPALEPGLEYFARVDAYLAEARRVSSSHVVFTVRR